MNMAERNIDKTLRRVGQCLALLFVLLAPYSVKAQVRDSASIYKPSDSVTLNTDSALIGKKKAALGHNVKQVIPGSNLNVRNEARQAIKNDHQSHNPRKALLLSAILPGAGQVYNKQAWKIPIIYGALSAGGYFIYDNYKNMRAYKDEYLYRVNHNDQYHSAEYEEYPTENIYNMYETYNQRFQLSTIITVAFYGINCLDAFVFGHLFEFEISDDLSMTCQPQMQYDINHGVLPGVGISLSF
jgi:hypothetical protein